MAQFLPNSARPGSLGPTTAETIDEGLRSYMLRVYNYMALGVAGTAALVLVFMSNVPLLKTLASTPVRLGLFFAILGLGFFALRWNIEPIKCAPRSAFETSLQFFAEIIERLAAAVARCVPDLRLDVRSHPGDDAHQSGGSLQRCW